MHHAALRRMNSGVQWGSLQLCTTCRIVVSGFVFFNLFLCIWGATSRYCIVGFQTGETFIKPLKREHVDLYRKSTLLCVG